MAEVAAVAKDVRRRWLSQGLRVTPIASEEIEGLRQLHPDGHWAEYETFLRIAGLPHEEDRNGVRFWLPREVHSARDVLVDAGYQCDMMDPSVIFADYLQESYWYGLWLAGPLIGRVSLVLGTADGTDPQPPIGSLVDFLLAYLNDDARMYPP